MKKVKNLESVVNKFNESSTTARIFFDPACNRCECRKYVGVEDGRFDYRKPSEILIISREIDYDGSEHTEETLTTSKLKELIKNALEEFEEGYY